MPCKLHFLDSTTLEVLQSAEDAAQLLWGREKGDDAHDKGFATLQAHNEVVHVNPATVTRVTPSPPLGQ